MATNDPTIGDQAVQTPSTGAHVFTVRVWKDELTGAPTYRGTVRDVMSDAFRGFREWSDLVAFIVGRVEQEERDVDR